LLLLLPVRHLVLAKGIDGGTEEKQAACAAEVAAEVAVADEAQHAVIMANTGAIFLPDGGAGCKVNSCGDRQRK
jgi:hypothetical protein